MNNTVINTNNVTNLIFEQINNKSYKKKKKLIIDITIRQYIISSKQIEINYQIPIDQQMKKSSLVTNQLIKQQGAVINLPQQVIQFFQSRIETEQTYCQGLLKLNNKFPNIQIHSTQSSKVLKHIKAIHTQKYHQTLEFINQMKSQKKNFQNLVKKSNQQLQKSTNEIKINQMNLTNILQKIKKLHTKGEQQIKTIDQKFLLKEFQLISADYKSKRVEDSLKLLDEQTKLCKDLKKEYQLLKTEGQKVIKRIKKHEKVVYKTSHLIQTEIKQLVKRYTVSQVSLIRNLQYDIDNMIKKTNIFDQLSTPIEEKQPKLPKNYIIKIAGEVFKQEFKIKDVFFDVKKFIAMRNQATLMDTKKNGSIVEDNHHGQFQIILRNWNESQNINELMEKLTQNYVQYKEIAFTFLKYFRTKNINKFTPKQFTELQKLFNLLWAKTCQQLNFHLIQQLIMYGNYYLCTELDKQKTSTSSLMELIPKKQYLSDIYFWRFVLFFGIEKSVIECFSIQNQKQMFLKNSMFGTLVMNSLNLIHYGIDKYVAKNNIAKIAKACGLTENQVGDLIKFVQSGYEKCQRRKGNK